MKKKIPIYVISQEALYGVFVRVCVDLVEIIDYCVSSARTSCCALCQIDQDNTLEQKQGAFG